MTFGLDSTAAMAGTRPLIPAGPIERPLIPASRPGSRAARADVAARARARARRTGFLMKLSRVSTHQDSKNAGKGPARHKDIPLAPGGAFRDTRTAGKGCVPGGGPAAKD